MCSGYCNLNIASWARGIFVVSFALCVCMYVCVVDSRAGFYLYTSQIYSHTHFMSHGNSKALYRRSMPSLHMKQCFEKTLKQYRPAIHHLTGWSFIKNMTKFFQTLDISETADAVSLAVLSLHFLFPATPEVPLLPSSLLSFLFCLIFVCAVLCRLSVSHLTMCCNHANMCHSWSDVRQSQAPV